MGVAHRCRRLLPDARPTGSRGGSAGLRKQLAVALQDLPLSRRSRDGVQNAGSEACTAGNWKSNEVVRDRLMQA